MSAGERAHAQARGSRGKGWRIAARLRVIVAAPLIAVFGFAGLALANTVGQAQQVGRLSSLVALATKAGDLAHDVQRERAAAANLLATGNGAQLDSFNQQTLATDATIATYRQRFSQAAGAVPPSGRTILNRVGDELNGLGQLREQVRFGAQASVSATTFGYRILVADLLAYRDSVAQVTASAGVADNMRAAAALAQAIESAGQQQVAVVQAVAAGQLTPAMQEDIVSARTGFTESSLSFLSLAPAQWVSWWERAGTGAAPLAAQELQDQVGRAVAGTTVQLDSTRWVNAQNAWMDGLYSLEKRIDGIVEAEVSAVRKAQVKRAGAEAGATALAMVLTILVTTVVARQLSRRLRGLRDTANEVAFSQLPAVVEELRVADPATVRPDRVAEQASTNLDRVTGDEIGELALAFAHVHRAAVRTAAEQAVMRANVGEIFVHLSRREQRLVDSVLAQVDRIERDEISPERLEMLYELDNLATRMARINSSLLVLGGVGAGRVRHEDVPLLKVLQAAQSQIEHYRRVRIGMIDDGLALVAEAVDEIVHLLAELLDNATLYSPPDSDAWMTARALHDRVVVQIGDEGVGLPSRRREELNRLLNRPPAIDVAAVRAMGLTVVGHLAARYGVRVELRPGPRLGTIAEVNIPLRLTRMVPRLEPLADQDAVAEVAGDGPAPTSLNGGVPVHAGANGAGFNGSAPGHGPTPAGGPPPASVPAQRTGSPDRSAWAPGPAAAGTSGLPTRRPTGAAANPPANTRQPTEANQPANPHQPVNAHQPATAHQPASAHLSTNPDPITHAGRGSRPNPLVVASSAGPGTPIAAVRAGALDDTAQLPIFTQVSGWFRRESGAADDAPNEWHTAADEAWKVAAAVAQPVQDAKTTSAGLPIRVPKQHLVPGGVAPATEGPTTATRQAAADRRDPNQVAAAMAAYARAVGTKRTAPDPVAASAD